MTFPEEPEDPIPPDPDPDKLAVVGPELSTTILIESTHSITDRLIDYHVTRYGGLTDLEREALKPIIRDLVNSAVVTVSWD